MSYFKRLLEQMHNINAKKVLVVACAEDDDVLGAVEKARKIGVIDGILVGEKDKIINILNLMNIEDKNYKIVDVKGLEESARKAVELVSQGPGDILMKGLVDTSILLKAVLDSEIGLRIQGNLLSHVGLFFNENYHKPFIVTDAAMNIAPTLDEKIKIIKNAVKLSNDLGVKCPKVACICAKEKVSDKMEATVHAKQLEELNKSGELKGCIVGGPFALDNAISKDAAQHKGMNHPVAGDADILLMPQIESGNVLYKALTYFSKSESAGLVVGAKAPIVLTSRADSEESKFNSILLGVMFNT